MSHTTHIDWKKNKNEQNKEKQCLKTEDNRIDRNVKKKGKRKNTIFLLLLRTYKFLKGL